MLCSPWSDTFKTQFHMSSSGVCWPIFSVSKLYSPGELTSPLGLQQDLNLLTVLEEWGKVRVALRRVASVFFQDIILRSGLWGIDSEKGWLLPFTLYQGEEATDPNPLRGSGISSFLELIQPNDPTPSGPYQESHFCIGNPSHMCIQSLVSSPN